ncbi:glycoside hydrolase family 12 protein [Gyrodon lividus]|nr:glycoside hydrolase family 12 protein [Gyrodon lividus]
MISLSLLLLLVPLVSGLLLQRRTTACGQYDVITAGSYSLLTNLWGATNATSGSQCSTLESVDENFVKWCTTWTWTGTSIKSFSNINKGVDRRLSAISSMPTTWNWSQASTGTVVADVAYDMYTSHTAGGFNVNEIMIWLANFNAGPISSQYDSSGQPVPIESNLSLGGYTWNLYLGSNGANQVYSFLPTGEALTSFSADLYPFLSYLVESQGISSSQYLTIVQAGTEATSGSATLTTSAYSLTIN